MMTDIKEEPRIAGLRSIKQEMVPGIYSYCTCGYSANQPFCDGSHEGTSFEPLKIVISDPQRISWCACKRSQKLPYCDGTHKTLPGYVKPS
jgi:CDGSH iron-sulfur domain-containing protein 3